MGLELDAVVGQQGVGCWYGMRVGQHGLAHYFLICLSSRFNAGCKGDRNGELLHVCKQYRRCYTLIYGCLGPQAFMPRRVQGRAAMRQKCDVISLHVAVLSNKSTVLC